MNETIFATVEQTIRPIKVAFLLDSKSSKTLKESIFYSSMLWGGKYNILVPIWTKRTAKSIRQHYIDLIKTTNPDFIVNLSTKKIPEELKALYEEDFIKGRPSFITKRGKEIEFKLGIRIYSVLNSLANEMDKNKIGSRSEKFAILGSSLENELALVATYGYLGNTDVPKILLGKFGAKEINSYKSFLTSTLSAFSPINIGSWNLKVNGNYGALSNTVIFVGKSDSQEDLIEFWNIRACGRHILYVPIEKQAEYHPLIKKYINAGYYKINNNGVYNNTNIIKGKSISMTEFEAFLADPLLIKQRGKYICYRWIPGWNDAPPYIAKQIESPEIILKSKNDNLQFVSEFSQKFNLGYPDFMDPSTRMRFKAPYYASDLGLSSFSLGSKTLSIPINGNLKKLIRYQVLGHIEQGGIRVSDRISLYSDRIMENLFLRPIESYTIFEQYFKENKISISYSEPGIISNNIIKHMGGNVDNCRIFKLYAVRKLLRDLSTVLGEEDSSEREDSKRRIKEGKPLQAIIYDIKQIHTSQDDYYGLVKYNPDTQGAEGVFQELYKKNIIRPGQLFKCENCHKEEWYGIEEFQKDFICRYCFHNQQVTLTKGRNDKPWRYKPDGLFVLPDGGQGSIATIVSLWFFDKLSFSSFNSLLLTSVNCKLTDNKYIECDFAVFYGNTLILGEAKNFTDLGKSQVDNMVNLAKSFSEKPILCFSTLKDEFSEKEKILLRKVVKKGFTVLPLTRIELDPYDPELGENSYGKSYIYDLTKNLFKKNIG